MFARRLADFKATPSVASLPRMARALPWTQAGSRRQFELSRWIPLAIALLVVYLTIIPIGIVAFQVAVTRERKPALEHEHEQQERTGSEAESGGETFVHDWEQFRSMRAVVACGTHGRGNGRMRRKSLGPRRSSVKPTTRPRSARQRSRPPVHPL